MTNYASLQETHDNDEETGVLVHVAEPSRARWNHIDDLDSFFSRMYQYHQRHGFLCMLLQEVLELVQFIFIIVLTCYIFYGIDYPVLFKDERPARLANATIANMTKVTLHDVIRSPGECVFHFVLLTWVVLIISLLIWVLKLIKGVYHMFYFWDIKQFYNTALRIDDSELDNLTWHEVQSRVRTVQIEQQMCIHKRELTELDIYHRILRQQNYFVAMVNKRLLPPRLQFPFIGEVVYWTSGLRYNIQLLFFWSPWAPFENPWHLREEYKKPNLRHDLASQFGRQILYFALLNLLLAPLIFLWQMLYTFFSYAALIRKEPSILAIRRWSLYGRLYLRHFNELEHELLARLTRAHRPATKYLAAFSSPLGTIVAENIGFYATSVLAVLVVLSVYDEDVLTVEHVLTIMTILTVAVAVLRTMAPDETTSSDLEDLLHRVLQHTHYLPVDWSGQAHTTRVRKEFEQLFQYGFVSLLENIFSPILTPYILWRHIYPRTIEIVDFFRNFTVSVVGVGDVCSFAQMDIRKHGNPEWHEEEISAPDQYSQAEDGKVELSLVHFQCTNPSWKPPSGADGFVRNVQTNSMIFSSDEYGPNWRIGDTVSPENIRHRGTSPFAPGGSRTTPLTQSKVTKELHMSRMWSNEGPTPDAIREMSMNAAYIHNVHSMKTEHRTRNTAQETTPLLGHLNH